MPSVKLTRAQKMTVLNVHLHTKDGSWYRATGSGERVTLASLYRRGLFNRQAWRGKEGERDAAYEYRPTDSVIQMFAEFKL